MGLGRFCDNEGIFVNMLIFGFHKSREFLYNLNNNKIISDIV